MATDMSSLRKRRALWKPACVACAEQAALSFAFSGHFGESEKIEWHLGVPLHLKALLRESATVAPQLPPLSSYDPNPDLLATAQLADRLPPV